MNNPDRIRKSKRFFASDLIKVDTYQISHFKFMNETSDWMKENNIVYIKTLSYTSTSNGLLEGKNRRIREVLRELMIRNNNRNWTNSLQIACDNLNSQRNGTTKKHQFQFGEKVMISWQ